MEKKFPEMQIKLPISMKYFAFGSILRNICGFQKLSNTQELRDPVTNVLKRHSLSIIYDSDASSYVAPANMTKTRINYDPVGIGKRYDDDAIIPLPHFPPNFVDIDNDQYIKKLRLWHFPRIPTIDGKGNDFLALIKTKEGDITYDFLTIKSQYALNPCNAGDIFLFSDNNVVLGTLIGNYLSELICQIPCPVYGFGWGNLEKDPTKTMDLETGSIILSHEPNQKEFSLLTETMLQDFNVNPRNAFGDLVQIPAINMEFIIKRFR